MGAFKGLNNLTYLNINYKNLSAISKEVFKLIK